MKFQPNNTRKMLETRIAAAKEFLAKRLGSIVTARAERRAFPGERARSRLSPPTQIGPQLLVAPDATERAGQALDRGGIEL